MSEAFIAQKKPYIVELEAGEHWFCACGRSNTQPFCDGSHNGTGIEPIKFSLEKGRKAGMCGCKRSNNLPFCDGCHKEL